MFESILYRKPLVTPEYQAQLDDLAETLVAGNRPIEQQLELDVIERTEIAQLGHTAVSAAELTRVDL